MGGSSEKVASRVPAVGLECEIPAARCAGMQARPHVSITPGNGWRVSIAPSSPDSASGRYGVAVGSYFLIQLDRHPPPPPIAALLFESPGDLVAARSTSAVLEIPLAEFVPVALDEQLAATGTPCAAAICVVETTAYRRFCSQVDLSVISVAA